MKITVGNSESRVMEASQEEFTALRNFLSYQIDAKVAHFSRSWDRTRYLIDKKGVFATGLLKTVLDWSKSNNLSLHLNDTRRVPFGHPGTFNLSLRVTPYPEQIEAVEAAKKFHRGTISAVTAFGKSIVMALLVQKLQLKTLIVVPTLGLKEQLTKNFLNYFGSLQDIQIENIDSTALKKPTFADVLICDEAHHVAAKTYRDLNKKQWSGIYYRFFFTGTPWRTKEEEQLLMEGVAGQVIYSIEYKQAVEKGYVAPIDAFVLDIPRTEVTGNNWASVYNQVVVNNKVRNEKIAELLRLLHNNKSPTLCLVKEIKHGDILSDLTGAAFANGQSEFTTEYIDAFNASKLTTMIGTSGVLGEGIDTKPAEFVIIAGLGKSKNQFMQNVGRVLRKCEGKDRAAVVIIRDPSHKWTLAHYKAQAKILLEEYGVKVVKLDL